MSRRFVSASSQYLENATAAVSAVPLSFACWFNATTTVALQGLVGVYNNAASNNHVRLILSATGSVSMTTGDGTTVNTASTSATASPNVWSHACGVSPAANSRAAFLNGGGKGTNVTSRSPSGLAVTSVGRISSSAPGSYASGQIAEAAIWSAALSDAEVLQLAQGALPPQVRPQSLVAYWPLREPGQGLEFDRNPWRPRGYDLLPNGATPADHPAFLLPRPPRRRLFGVTAGGGGGFKAAWAASSNILIGSGGP